MLIIKERIEIMNVLEIIRLYLEQNGYEGLVAEVGVTMERVNLCA